MAGVIRRFKERHGELYEFILFNLLSNIATITNFAILNLSSSFLFASLAERDFSFWIFDYSRANGGLGGFLSFLLSYACAQAVNFIVQRKLVFGADNKLGKAIPIYIVTIFTVYLICLYVPTIVMAPLTRMFGSFAAANITNILNVLIQVVINYPVMKFVIMKKTKEERGSYE